MAKNISVMGIYTDRATVAEAVKVLEKSGYRPADISVLASDNLSSKDFGHRRRARAMEGAGCGAALGAVIGAVAGWLISTQVLPVPSWLAPLVSSGPLLATFAGAGAGAALGWLVGLLMGMRLTEYVAQRYSGRIRRGGILVSVHCDSSEWCARAKKALQDTGAREISSAPESAADYGTTDKPTGRAPLTSPVTSEAPSLRAVAIDRERQAEPDVEELKK